MTTAMTLILVTMLPAIVLIGFAGWRGKVLARERWTSRMEVAVRYTIEQWQLPPGTGDMAPIRQAADRY
jgi:hypothetical protein